MKKRLFALFLAGVMVLSLSSCYEKKEPIKYSELEAFPVTIQNITLEKEPSSIIVLSEDALTALSDLGLSNKIVGISEEMSQPSGKDLPLYGTAKNPDFDEILAKSVDLVITDYPFPNSEMTRFDKKNCKVLVLPSLEDEPNVDYKEILSLLKGNPVVSSEAEE